LKPSGAEGRPEGLRYGTLRDTGPGSPVDQARTIARATFDGFMQSDLMPQGMQAPALIWLAAFLVGPAVFLPAQHLVKYPMIRRFHPELLERVFWNDRMLFLLMSAGAIGIVCVVLWQTLFPARRDAFVLTPLPVALRVQMAGRLLGLLGLCTLFAVGLNAVPTLTFPIVSSASALEMPRGMIAHLITASAADAFVFFSLTSLQGVVILGVGTRAAGKLASVAQAAAVLFVMLALFFIGGIQAMTTDALIRNNPSDPYLLWNPVAWFLGLYEFLMGSPRPVMGALAWRAVLAAAAPVAVTIAIYAFGYRQLLKRAVETPSRSTRSLPTRAASRLVRWTFIRRPEEQAIAAFVIRAIGRSQRHSLLMSIYVGGSLAMMITFVLPDVLRHGPSALATPTLAALALPLVLSAGLAVGIRILMAIPAEMPARWVFQTSAISKWRVDAAAHKTLLLLVLPPVMAAAALTAGPLWSWRLGAVHAVYCGTLALLLCEVLLVRYSGVPLTKPYVPGGSRFHMLWALYLSLFFTYTFTSVRLERDLYDWYGPRGVLNAAAVYTGLAVCVWARRKWKLRSLEAVTFEAELPEDVMFQGFNLTEIYAAQAVAAHGAKARGGHDGVSE
jgi:hypothetical protein